MVVTLIDRVLTRNCQTNKVFLITNKKVEDLSNNKNINYFITKSRKYKFVNDRILSSFNASIILMKLVFLLKKKNTFFFSMQSHFFPVLLSFFLNFRIIIRVSEDPCGAFLHSENKFFSLIVTLSKFFTYNFAYKVIVNANESKKCVKNFVFNKKKNLFTL